jgi:hypothetical protein
MKSNHYFDIIYCNKIVKENFENVGQNCLTYYNKLLQKKRD